MVNCESGEEIDIKLVRSRIGESSWMKNIV